jgi:hypothetical protein
MNQLRAMIQESVTCGRLPKVDCVVTWYGLGRGQLCAACNQRILGSEVGVDCDLSDGSTLRLHARCYTLWHSLLQA